MAGSAEQLKIQETLIPAWEQTELTAVLRLRELGTPETHERVIDEIATDGAELLDAPMTTRRQLDIQDNQVITKENEPLRDMWERGRRAKQKRAMQDGRFWSDYQRSFYEAEEQVLFEEEVIPSFIHNAQITFTPYAQDQEEAFGTEFIDTQTHYKRDRKYGLIRILYQLEPEVAEVVSVSVENSHQLEAFHAVAEELGHKIPEDTSHTDMLSHHIPVFVQPENRLDFERKLVDIFDTKLSELLGGEYKQGRPKYKAGVEAYNFVVANQDILEVYTHEIEKLARDESLIDQQLLKAVRIIRRSYMAMLYERHEQHDQSLPPVVRSAKDIDYSATYQQMMGAGYRIGQRGIRLLGCGTALDPMELLGAMTNDEFKQVVTSTNERYDFDQKMYCVVCQAPPAKDEKKKMCGPCGICKPCDARLKVKAA